MQGINFIWFNNTAGGGFHCYNKTANCLCLESPGSFSNPTPHLLPPSSDPTRPQHRRLKHKQEEIFIR